MGCGLELLSLTPLSPEDSGDALRLQEAECNNCVSSRMSSMCQ